MRIAMALAAALISASSMVFAEQANEEPNAASTTQEQAVMETLQQLQAGIEASPKPDLAAMNAMMKLLMIMGNKAALERMAQSLMRSKLEDLYVLKVLPMPCMQATLIDCTGLENDQVKSVVDIAIEARKSLQSERREEERAVQARNDAWVSRAMALGGIGISFCSLLLSGLSYRDKRREASKPEAPEKGPA